MARLNGVHAFDYNSPNSPNSPTPACLRRWCWH